MSTTSGYSKRFQSTRAGPSSTQVSGAGRALAAGVSTLALSMLLTGCFAESDIGTTALIEALSSTDTSNPAYVDVPLLVAQVQCSAPLSLSTPQSCTVSFVADLGVSDTKVSIGPRESPFPAAFSFKQEIRKSQFTQSRYRVKIETGLDRNTIPLGEAAPRLARTIEAAYKAAVVQEGAVFQVKRTRLLNRESYL